MFDAGSFSREVFWTGVLVGGPSATFDANAYEPTVFAVGPDPGPWWFFPPTRERLPFRDQAWPPSYHRLFNQVRTGVSVVIGGREYLGGRWHRVSPGEVEAIIAEGYGDRLAQAVDPARLPVLDR